MSGRLSARRAVSLLRAGPRRQLLVVEAACSLLIARLSLRILGFPAVARRFGPMLPPKDTRVPHLALDPSAPHVRTVRSVGWSVAAAARYAPFKAVCLQQALAARAMLQRRGVSSVLHFAVGAEGGSRLEAHAWLQAAGVPVVGYPLAPHLSEVGCFL